MINQEKNEPYFASYFRNLHRHCCRGFQHLFSRLQACSLPFVRFLFLASLRLVQCEQIFEDLVTQPKLPLYAPVLLRLDAIAASKVILMTMSATDLRVMRNTRYVEVDTVLTSLSKKQLKHELE